MKKVLVAVGLFIAVSVVAKCESRFFYQKEITVNDTTPVVIFDGNVNGVYIYSPGVDYKISLNTDNYTPMKKGGAFNFNNIRLEKMTLKIIGDNDSGKVYVIYTK